MAESPIRIQMPTGPIDSGVPDGVVAVDAHPGGPPADAWEWVVEYADGAELREHDPDGTDHGFAEVDHARAVRLVLLPVREGVVPHVVVVDSAAEERLIFFRRRTVRTDPATDVSSYEATVHCVGFQKTVRGVNFQSFTFLFDDGSVVVAADRNAV